MCLAAIFIANHFSPFNTLIPMIDHRPLSEFTLADRLLLYSVVRVETKYFNVALRLWKQVCEPQIAPHESGRSSNNIRPPFVTKCL